MSNPRAIPPELVKLLGDRLTIEAIVREEHGSDESSHASHPPDAVAFPESTEEVAEIVKICAHMRCQSFRSVKARPLKEVWSRFTAVSVST